MSSDFDRFLKIREAYKEILPAWQEEYEKTGNMYHDPYFMEWSWQFTPIENAVWSDIRSAGLPFYPQIPALNYFLDFACPMLKIGIECDGKAWHDHDMDKARDARLAAAGWMIFRIEGHECNRMVEPWEEHEDEPDGDLLQKWFMSTSEGIVRSIKETYFVDGSSKFAEKYSYQIAETLFEHRSTPDNYPVRRSVRRNDTGPMRMFDALAGYFENLVERMRKEAA